MEIISEPAVECPALDKLVKVEKECGVCRFQVDIISGVVECKYADIPYVKWKNGKDLTEDEKRMLIGEDAQFEIKTEGEQFRLVDLQGANLGDIESERFGSLNEILSRISHYLDDVYRGEI